METKEITFLIQKNNTMKPDFSKAAILGRLAPAIDCSQLDSGKYMVIDVRSAAEYVSGTIPGAVNIPLFDEDERSVIGTLYTHASKDSAVEQGFAYADEKLDSLLCEFTRYSDMPLAIFCARGGMRSRSIVNVLNQTGYAAVQLEGGYKSFRTKVLQTVENFAPPLIVLHGLTGTGKTRILQHLDNAIDLEDLAQHRSSLFGALGTTPRNQRDFEALLAEQIGSAGTPPFFVEGESRKIGRVFIPKAFAMAMKAGVMVNVTASLETRIDRIIEDYPVDSKKRVAEIEAILKSLVRSMGRSLVEEMCGHLAAGDLESLVHILLVEYYDKRYARSMQNYRFQLEISSEDIAECARQLTAFRGQLL